MAENKTLAVREEPFTLFGTTDPIEVIERASRLATALAKIVNERKLYAVIQGRKFPTVEGWTMLGGMVGVFAHTEWTRPVTNEAGQLRGYQARVSARTLSGIEVGAAEALCLRGESQQWGESAKDYALISMAQTRATSKAMGNPLRWIFKLAGYETAGAEEMPGHVSQDGEIEPAKASPESRAAIKGVETRPRTKAELRGIDQISAMLGQPADEVAEYYEGKGASRTQTHIQPPRRRGRPLGIKNKAKAPQPQGTQSERSEAGISSSQRGGQTASAMTSAPPLGSVEDGKAEYVESLRQQARQAAAQLARLRVKLTNQRNRERIALGTTTALELPALAPNPNSDAALERFIGACWEGQTLGGLSDSQMETDLLPALQEMIDEIHASGVSEND